MVAMRRLSRTQLEERNYSMLIYQAIRLAGGPSAVARQHGLSHGAPTQWARRGAIPLDLVDWLAEACGGRITATEILNEMKRLNPRRARRIDLMLAARGQGGTCAARAETTECGERVAA